MKTKIIYLVAFVFIAVSTQTALAQDDPQSTEAAAAALNKKAQNPIASMNSLPFQFNFNMGMGEYDRMQTILNFQPVIATQVGENWNMINRIIIPITIQPDLNSASTNYFGVGTTNYTAFFAPTLKGKTAIGFGPSMLIPTNTSNELGNGQFAIGPSVVLFASAGKFTLGFVAAQNWAFSSPNEAEKQSSFFTQYFINYNMKKQWSVGMAPTITVNWNAEKGQKAVVPFGLNVGKLTKLGSRPTRFSLGYYYNVVKPDNGAKGGQLQFMMVFLFPKG